MAYNSNSIFRNTVENQNLVAGQTTETFSSIEEQETKNAFYEPADTGGFSQRTDYSIKKVRQKLA